MPYSGSDDSPSKPRRSIDRLPTNRSSEDSSEEYRPRSDIPHELTHNILTIPGELFDSIARHVPPQDLCHLRLVSRVVAARVLDVYTEVHFTKRFFLLYRESLETLAKIAESEYFGRQLKKVVLCVDELPPAAIEDITRSEIEEASSAMVQVGGSSSRIGKDMREQLLPLAGQDVRRYHKDEDVSPALLFKIFKQLRRLGNTPAVQVTTADLLSRKPSMYQTFSKEARAKLAVKPESNLPTFARIMAVIAQSNLRVTELDMCPGEMDWMICGSAFGVPLYTALRYEQIWRETKAAFKSLRKLKISMGELEEHTRENGKHTVTDSRRMAEVFAGMRSLEELVLRQDARNAGLAPDLRLGKPFLALTFPSLRDLTLDGWEIDLRDLPAFLKRQPKLERLRLNLCELTHAITHPAKRADGTFDTIAKRLRNATAIPVVIVTGGIYFIEENVENAEYKFCADSASKAGEEVKGQETYEKVASW